MVARRYDVYLVPLDPALGAEVKKTRPCVVVSPETINRYVQTVMVAPLTPAIRKYPFRVACRFAGRDGQVALEQIRTLDRSRLRKYLGQLPAATQGALSEALVAMFTA